MGIKKTMEIILVLHTFVYHRAGRSLSVFISRATGSVPPPPRRYRKNVYNSVNTVLGSSTWSHTFWWSPPTPASRDGESKSQENAKRCHIFAYVTRRTGPYAFWNLEGKKKKVVFFFLYILLVHCIASTSAWVFRVSFIRSCFSGPKWQIRNEMSVRDASRCCRRMRTQAHCLLLSWKSREIK